MGGEGREGSGGKEMEGEGIERKERGLLWSPKNS